jgi:SOS-response transcriptional repressor LexA
MSDESRVTLERLCNERGETLAGLSRLLGRNDAYMQQYLRKGTPRRLPERERRTLARYFGVPDSLLGGPEADPELDVGALIRVEGDSMSPTLDAGDDILVDLDDTGDRLRDGIYVLRVDDMLLVKRLALHPFARQVTVQSDNPAYPDWPNRNLDEFDLIGRVIWAGGRVG